MNFQSFPLITSSEPQDNIRTQGVQPSATTLRHKAFDIQLKTEKGS